MTAFLITEIHHFTKSRFYNSRIKVASLLPIRRFVTAVAVVVVAALVLSPTPRASALSHPHDGPSACTAGNPPFPYRGYCATYSGRNTWYGSYGPGFPTALGWGFCASNPASGAAYPAPSYGYVPTSPPSGASTSANAPLGFAISEGQVRGWFTSGQAGSFTANQAAAAAFLLMENVLWGSPIPTMDAGLTAAYNSLRTLYNAATGATGNPRIAITLAGGGTSFTTSATLNGAVTFPGSNKGLVGSKVTISITGGHLNSPTGPTSQTVTTGTGGAITTTIFDNGTGGSPVQVRATASVGQLSMSYYRPTQGYLAAQVLGASLGPTAIVAVGNYDTVVPVGTVTIAKAVDNGAYYGPAGATFLVIDGSGTTVAELTTDQSGATPVSDPLLIGSYLVRESIAPEGYLPAPDQHVTVSAGVTTTVTYDGATIEHSIPATLSLDKVDATTGVALEGAVFHLAFDPTGAGTYSVDLGTCTTGPTGSCAIERPPPETALLPGNYLVTEVTPPPGYGPAVPSEQRVTLLPGQLSTVRFANPTINTMLTVAKYNSSEPGTGVPDAVYDLYARDPGPPGGTAHPVPTDAAVLAGLSWFDRGTTSATGELHFSVPIGFSWCVKEQHVPPGYVMDPGLHCTGILNKAAPAITIEEAVSPVTLTVRKFNSTNPSLVIPGAVYDLVVEDPFPLGFTPPPPPVGLQNPPGTTYFATGVTNAQGMLAFSVPSGYKWCIHERSAPPPYQRDPGWHCTATLVESSPSSATTIAVPETKGTLPFTGTGSLSAAPLGIALVAVGVIMRSIAARRRRSEREEPLWP